jgi:hypothetical protein
MVRTGVGPAGVLRPQAVPAHPDGNVGAFSVIAGMALAGTWLPVSTAWGMKPLSTVAANTTTRHQRQRNDMTIIVGVDSQVQRSRPPSFRRPGLEFDGHAASSRVTPPVRGSRRQFEGHAPRSISSTRTPSGSVQ